ncbi:MAG TPA: FG-GAP-like repeat-containing protein [Candidatus Syntrophosphaera thermopropionivorans]|nr:FG-GAP-like repeat-containing protein [Candidatus Syntrophosphaera thermopropionivorans]
MQKIIIILVFCSFAGTLFSQSPMQLLVSIESPFATDLHNLSLAIIIKGNGDINGDGYNDIVLAGQPLGSENGRREVYIYLGRSTLNTEPDYIIPDPSEPDAAGPNNYFGSAIAYNGDLNGDGYCDLVISDYLYGWYGWGRVYVYFGGPDFNTTPDLILDGLDYGSQTEVIGLNFGNNTDISGDFNGDGFNDLVVSSEHGNLCHYGQVDIFFGGPDLDTTCDWFYYGDMCEQFGYVLSVGDLNGDGYSDLVVCSVNYLQVDNQEIKLFFGGAYFNNVCDAIFGGFYTNYVFIRPLMDTDFNNDSYDDLVIYQADENEFKICWGSADVELDFEIWHTPPPTNIRSPYTARFDDSRYLCYGTPQLETFNFYRWDNEAGFALDYIINENYNPTAGSQQSYYLGDVNGDGHSEILLSDCSSSPFQFKVFTTKDESNSTDDNILTSPLQLSVYPNPFTQSLSLTYNLKEPGMIELSVYNVKGQLVANISSDYRRIGQHNEIWDGRDSLGRKLPSGVYLVKLSVCDKYIICKKVTLCY